MNPIYILAFIVLGLIIWSLLNKPNKQEEKQSLKILRTVKPEDCAPNFHTWELFLYVKYKIKFKENNKLKDNSKITLTSK